MTAEKKIKKWDANQKKCFTRVKNDLIWQITGKNKQTKNYPKKPSSNKFGGKYCFVASPFSIILPSMPQNVMFGPIIKVHF